MILISILAEMGVSFSWTFNDGRKCWYRNFQLHRDNDLPAIEFINGAKAWYQYGKYYRDDDKPAIDDDCGYRRWYRHGRSHRGEDLPAIEYQNGDKIWYHNNQVHRDGNKAAIEYINGEGQYVKRGIGYTLEQLAVYYFRLTIFGRRCLMKFGLRRLKRVRWIHGELLCMPPKGNFQGGGDYHKMSDYFNKL